MMGSQRLKIKDELHYRKGPTSGGCGDCNHIIGGMIIKSFTGAIIGTEDRCKIIGLDASRKYRIRTDHICDRFDNSRMMKRLMGSKGYKKFIEEHHREKEVR